MMSEHCNSLLLPAHKAYVTLMLCGGIYVDNCAMESLSLAGNVPTDAIINIFKAKSIPNMLQWVNDFMFFHIPTLHPPVLHSLSHVQYGSNSLYKVLQ